MRVLNSILALSLLSGAAYGQSKTLLPTSASVPADKTAERQAKVSAAVDNAVATLYDDVQRQQIFGRVTVRDLLIRTGGTDTLMATLRNADQIGGPRWIDEQTVQVRLAVTGPVLAATLVDIAATAKDKSPVKPEELSPLLEQWGRRTFTAVGVSGTPLMARQPAIEAHRVGSTTQPVMWQPPRWANQTIQADGQGARGLSQLRSAYAAQEAALIDLRKQVDKLPIEGNGTLADTAKSDARVNAAIDRAVSRAKLSRVDYQADGSASVRASLDLADLWREIDAARQSNPVYSPR